MVYQVSLHFQLVSVFATEVKSDSINSILENMDFLRSQLTSGITDEVQKALVTIQGHPVFFSFFTPQKRDIPHTKGLTHVFLGWQASHHRLPV